MVVHLSFPEPSLTSVNLSTVLDVMEDKKWIYFGHCVNLPHSEINRIQRSSDKEKKQAVVRFLISHHPALSWTLVARALYQMVVFLRDVGIGDSSHRALEYLQQDSSGGTITACTVNMHTSCRISRNCMAKVGARVG